MFSIEFSSRAKKEYDKLKNKRIDKILKTLVLDPVPAKKFDVKKLRGIKDTFRIRLGSIRIVYTVIWSNNIIIVSRVSPRESVYD
jgi:mRNA interferase RelE/StbE